MSTPSSPTPTPTPAPSPTPTPNSDQLDQMFQDATAACQRIWNAVNDAQLNGVSNIEVHVLNGSLVVSVVKGMQKVWIDAPSTVNFASVIRSETPAVTQIQPS